LEWKAKIAIIWSGVENSYLVGLVSGLSKLSHLNTKVIDSDNKIGEFDNFKHVNFLNYRGGLDPRANLFSKIKRILNHYLKLITYAYKNDSKILHIQWVKN